MSGEISEQDLIEPSSVGSMFVHEGTSYHIEPTAFSSKVIKALVRLYDHRMKEQVPDLLVALRQCKTEDEKAIVKEMYEYTSDRAAKIQLMIQTEEGVATVLSLCCNQIESYEQALDIVQSHPRFFELIEAIVSATGLEAAGN